jgi:hypothetical protein
VDTPWYRLNSVVLPNPEPPIYPRGDNVQAIERATLPLVKDAALQADELIVQRALLDLIHQGKEIDAKHYPYSPSLAGAKNERSLLEDLIAEATFSTNASLSRQLGEQRLRLL